MSPSCTRACRARTTAMVNAGISETQTPKEIVLTFSVTMSQDLLETIEGGIATLTMNRPEARNALSARMFDGLSSRCETALGHRGPARAMVPAGPAGDRRGPAGASLPLPQPLKLLRSWPLLRSIPAYLVGVGARPEHVRSPQVARASIKAWERAAG